MSDTYKFSKAEQVVSPFMVYTASDAEQASISELDLSTGLGLLSQPVDSAVRNKVTAKIAIGPPHEKTYYVSDDSSRTRLTPDRQAALDITDEIIDRSSGSIDVYTLAQTALCDGNLSMMRQSSYRGLDLWIRVEEGLSYEADMLASLAENESEATYSDDYGITKVGVRGLKRLIQTRGYELRNGAESCVIPNIPSCESYMAAAAIDQTRLANSKITRILPWFMEDREEAARFLSTLAPELAGHPPIESVILGPTGDIKRVFGWNGFQPKETRELLSSRKAHAVASRMVDVSHGAAMRRWSEGRNGGQPVDEIISKEMTFSERLRLFSEEPNRIVPLFTAVIKPNAAYEQVASVFSAIDGLLSEVSMPAQTTIKEVSYIDGKNTNGVLSLDFRTNLTVPHRESNINIKLIFESVGAGEALKVEHLANSSSDAYRAIVAYLESTGACLRYALAEVVDPDF